MTIEGNSGRAWFERHQAKASEGVKKMGEFKVSLDKINEDTWQITLMRDYAGEGFYIVGQYDNEQDAERAFRKMWDMNLAHAD